jgi:hypothetical protein
VPRRSHSVMNSSRSGRPLWHQRVWWDLQNKRFALSHQRVQKDSRHSVGPRESMGEPSPPRPRGLDCPSVSTWPGGGRIAPVRSRRSDSPKPCIWRALPAPAAGCWLPW